MGFFEKLDELVSSSVVRVERARGTTHPRFQDVCYPLDYGHLEHTMSDDGAELDVFRGTARDVGVVGVVLTVDAVKRDAEMKVLVDCSAEEVLVAQEFCAVTLGLGGMLVRRDH